MWNDIKRWIIYLYFAIGLMLGFITNITIEPTVKGLKLLIYLLNCSLAWLPIIIAGVIAKVMGVL